MAFFSRIFFVAGIFVPFFLEWGKINMQQVLLLQSWFMFWLLIFEVPSGTLADYLGRKITLNLTFLILIVAILAYGLTPKFIMFLLAEFLWAIAMAMLSGTFHAFVYETLEVNGMQDQSKIMFSRIESVMLIANFISTPIGGWIASISSPRYAMLFSAVPIFIALALSLFLKEPKIREIKAHDMDTDLTIENEVKPNRKFKKRSQKSYRKILKDGILFFKKEKVLRILAFEAISFQVIGYYLRWYYQEKLLDLNVDVVYMGIIHTAILGTQLLIINLIPKFEEWFGSKKIFLQISPIILGLAYFAVTIPNAWTIIIASILGVSFNFARRPILDSYMNKLIRSEERATVISLISMIRQVFLMIFNLIFGYIGENYLDYLFWGLGITTFVFLIISKIEEHHLID